MDKKIYYPYESNDKKHKYFIITKSGRKINFCAYGYSDYTEHKDEARKERYIKRHEIGENWSKSGIDSVGFWSRWLLWNKKTIKEVIMILKTISIKIIIYRNNIKW